MLVLLIKCVFSKAPQSSFNILSLIYYLTILLLKLQWDNLKRSYKKFILMSYAIYLELRLTPWGWDAFAANLSEAFYIYTY